MAFDPDCTINISSALPPTFTAIRGTSSLQTSICTLAALGA